MIVIACMNIVLALLCAALSEPIYDVNKDVGMLVLCIGIANLLIAMVAVFAR